MGASFFNDLATKEEEAEKKAAEPADVTSVGDQETMITEEEFQPINKSALQSSLFGTKGFPAFHFSESKTKANDYGEVIFTFFEVYFPCAIDNSRKAVQSLQKAHCQNRSFPKRKQCQCHFLCCCYQS